MMKTTLYTPLSSICDAIKNLSGMRVLNYGEAVDAVAPGEGGNYVTIDGQRFCSVDDQYDVVLFFIRLSARPNTDVGPGRSQFINREVSYRLVVNTKKFVDVEPMLNFALNRARLVTLGNANYANREVARTYFGLDERRADTQFFTIDFTLVERIDCRMC